MTTYRLHYFNIRDRAEVVRLIFAAADQQIDDIRYKRIQWTPYKAEMPLAGNGNLEQAKVDAIADTITNLMVKCGSVHKKQVETKNQAVIQKFLVEELPQHLADLETVGEIYSDGGYFFVGNHLTWTDLFLYDLLETIFQHDDHILAKFPWLKSRRKL
ncbi:unnamed protein product [Adineta steineri]|uniref:glutathione transferase n=1 Tax=Adineta steineri TaxID=433720 RepID=A0A815GPJ9_9BILA|nr:unnamed protein product [Adineta steineri]CAF1366230.1 unnamed protein product [Adineta steineri]CAF3622301.1 unnamed protein product [Adineta steineri]CAF4241264.1 unnamed protein product [Adineta steineri]